VRDLAAVTTRATLFDAVERGLAAIGCKPIAVARIADTTYELAAPSQAHCLCRFRLTSRVRSRFIDQTIAVVIYVVALLVCTIQGRCADVRASRLAT
jgi:hypothetical protein